jgi:hypothetical protein
MFSTYSSNKRHKIELADGKTTTSAGTGLVYVKTLTGASVKLECLHVPELVGNLISMARLYRKGCFLVNTGLDQMKLVNASKDVFKVKISNNNVFLIRIKFVTGKSKSS